MRCRLPLWAIAHAAALCACHAQRTADYRRDALLSLQGSVDIVGEKRKDELVPALAFISGSDVFTAVPKEHPSKVRYAGGGTTGDTSCAGNGCINKNTWCTTDDECYAETEMCPDADSPPEACTITESSGDPGLKEDLFSHFAGLSENYTIAYLHGDAPKHSVTAYRLGAAKTGLSAGYHLIELEAQPPMEELEDAGPDCTDRAYELGVTRYNEKHGTHYEFGRSPTFGCFDDDPPSCDKAVGDEFQRLILKATAELDCPLDGAKRIPVTNPEQHPIAVQIGPSLHLL
jgi:hypothetical protein